MQFNGLTDEQVIQSREECGTNKLSQKEMESFWHKLIIGFTEKLIMILIVALSINIVFVILGKASWVELVGIATAILVANFTNVYFQHKNESTFQALQDEASKTTSKVIRNGKVVEIPSDDIVVGDIVMLQPGDKIPADGVLVQGRLNVDQAALNGETLEALKEEMPNVTAIYDTKDLLNKYYVYRGTVVCSGEALLNVVQVGDSTMYGGLAKEMQEDGRESPLKVKLNKIADMISKAGYTMGVLVAVAYAVRGIMGANADVMVTLTDFVTLSKILVDSVMLAVIIIVMAVPEGLPMMIAIVLAMNMGKMLKSNVLVRKSNGVETAGAVEILFSDKTGTITKGVLEVVEIMVGNNKVSTLANVLHNDIKNKIMYAIGLNNSSYTSDKGQAVGGNSTDRALLNFLIKEKLDSNLDKWLVVKTEPFDSAKKYSTATINYQGYASKYIKGAPEKIIGLCDYCVGVNGEKIPLDMDVLNEYMDAQSKRSMRLIALAVTDDTESEELSGEMTLLGLISIRDDVRPEAVTAIAEVKKAGVQVVMVTGDRKETAVAIATEAGLLDKDAITDFEAVKVAITMVEEDNTNSYEGPDIVLTSAELNQLTDEDVKAIIRRVKVVARALPLDKSRLVRLAQELNLVVGMTGDGVNDAPALKRADVGFAMGISGTEVAKEAGDIVILDDNFSSIEKAILYGRTIFKSIRKFIVFQLTVNVAAVSLCFIGPFLGVNEPLNIIDILWVNMVMDTLAALSFGTEPVLQRYMQEKPVKRDENIISKYMASSILSSGIIILAGSLAVYFVGNRLGLSEVYNKTLLFTFFIFAVIFNGFNARTERVNIFEGITKNKGFLIIMGLIAIMQVIMIYIGGAVLGTVPLKVIDLIYVTGVALMIIPIDIVRKFIVSK